ncbi:FAD-dependent oxidoreductase, partial [Georgenia sp. 10Sc9-8]|nr:FAD-dependent oxidoreductase [Georgenia halotolerans]
MTVEHVEALVLGAGMAGLTTAYRLTQRGLRPVVLEADTRVGGTVRGGTVGDHALDLGAESFALRRPEARALAEELGLAVQEPAGGGSSVWAPTGPDGVARALPIPADSILGIPAHPDAADALAAIGPDGAARAARDAHLGPGPGSDATDLASLVRVRMGQAVLDRLVRPVAGGIHAADPTALAVDSVAPGLRAAMAERGSLAGAVAALRERAPAGAVVATTAGGLFRMVHALREAVDAQGEVRTGRRVTDLRPVPTGGWEVRDAAGGVLRAPLVVLALPGPA